MGKLRSDVPLRAGYDRPLKPGEVPAFGEEDGNSSARLMKTIARNQAVFAFSRAHQTPPLDLVRAAERQREQVEAANAARILETFDDREDDDEPAGLLPWPGPSVVYVDDGTAKNFSLAIVRLGEELAAQANAAVDKLTEQLTRDMVLTPAGIGPAGEVEMFVTLPPEAFAGFQAECGRIEPTVGIDLDHFFSPAHEDD